MSNAPLQSEKVSLFGVKNYFKLFGVPRVAFAALIHRTSAQAFFNNLLAILAHDSVLQHVVGATKLSCDRCCLHMYTKVQEQKILIRMSTPQN